MKALNRAIACLLLFAMFIAYIPMEVFAATNSQDVLSINNGYIQYSINKKTGGFSIRTLEGHPQKKYDNNIPLLFKEDTNSTETSFTTVRIDGKDYIFGQDYGWFGVESKLYEPVVNFQDKTIITKWVIEGIEITQKVAVSGDENNDLCGNAGIAYEVKNTNAVAKEVGLRTLLDTALGKLDSPYMIAGYESIPTVTEREFIGTDVPDQIRGMDSIMNPAMMNYSILKGWSDGAVPDRVIIGHWGNLANTRYDYTPNKNCDFSNYSSVYRTPDSALAFYWNEQNLDPNTTRKAEFLYGIGNFSSQLTSTNVNINMDVDRVFTTKDKKGYENGGIFDVRVEVDNTVDNAQDISFATLSLSLEEGLSIVEDEIAGDYNLAATEDVTIESIPAGTIVQKYWRIKAAPQTNISAKEISVSLHTTTTDPATVSRYVILPSATGSLPNITFDTVTPNKFYTLGDKNINITGSLAAFKSLAGKTGWDLYLRHVATGDLTKIKKEQIAFTGDNLNTLSFTTDEELAVGEYEIVFHFIDNQLVEDFTTEIIVKQKIEVNLDRALENKAYGIITVLRYDKDKYKFVVFRNEEELLKYRSDNKLDNFNCTESEMLLEVRGKIQEFKETIGGKEKVYYAADPNISEVTINNVVQYNGKEPLILKDEDNGTIVVNGNGKISVVDNLVFWNSGFNIEFRTGLIHTLMPDKVSFGPGAGQVRDVLIEYTGIGKIIQNIGGSTIDLKYGVLTENWNDNTNQGRAGYAINFGGKIALTFLKGDKKEKKSGTDGATDPPSTGTSPAPEENMEKSEFDDGTVTANIEDVLYGESENKVEFLGINTTARVVLPKRVFGGFIKNVQGVYGELTINTLDNIYAVAAGVQLYVIECTGELRIKIVEINDVMSPIPDKLYFYLSNEKGVPISPPTLYLTGLGGGYDNLADSITGNYVGSLPPLTLYVDAGIKMVQVLEGDFSLAISLKGMSLAGVLTLNKHPGLTINTGISTQWVDPWYLSMYGELDAYEVIQGGVSITIADDYFYGYGYVRLIIPDDIPIVGGAELSRVEAAISSTMIGMNVKVLLTKIGVVYYWDSEEVDFGDSIDLGGMTKFSKANSMSKVMYVEKAPFGSQDKDLVAMYGTNVRRLTSSTVVMPPIRSLSTARAISFTSSVVKEVICDGEDALIFAIPYTGSVAANTDMISLTNPDGKRIELKLDQSINGGEEGNFLVQSIDENEKVIYISVTDSSYIVDGAWTINSYDSAVAINNFVVNAVDNIPELTIVNLENRIDDTSNQMNVSWGFDSEGSKLDNATVDIYLSKNKNVLEEAKQNGAVNTENLGVCIGQYPARDKKATVDIPDTMNSDTYYIIAVLALDDLGPSILACKSPIVFENTELPVPVKGVVAEYGGNGTIKVNIKDAESYDYTHYNVYVIDESGNAINDAMGSYTIGSNIVLGGNSILKAGEDYKVLVQTVKEENNKKYISDSNVYSNVITMPVINTPVLQNIESNIDNTTKYSQNNILKLKYTFDQEVNLKVLVNNVDNIKSDEYKNEWEIETILPDGEYVISIEAVNRAGDSYVPTVGKVNKTLLRNLSINPILAFTIDTTIPVLRIGSYTENSFAEKVEATISKQTIWLKNGVLSLCGMTEAGSEILLGGSSQGITVESDGSFVIERAVDLDGAIKKDMLLSVTDKAGNKNTTTIYAVDGDVSALKALNIKLVEEGGAYSNIEIVDGYKTVTMNTGEIKHFCSMNSYEMSDGSVKDYLVLSEQLDWSVIYGSNLIDFSEGRVYAKAPGEVVIKSGILSAGFKENQNDDEKLVSTEDVVIIKITGEPVYNLPYKPSGKSKDSSLENSLKKLIAEIGEENIIKTISVQSAKQESVVINESLSITIPIYSVDKNDILVLYKPKNIDEMNAKAQGTVLSDIMIMTLVSGQKLKKPVTFVYDYSKDNVFNLENIGFYKYNKLFDKWEYILGKNSTETMRSTVEVDGINEVYAFIDNAIFNKYNDISGHWAEKYIYGLSSLSVINGVKEGDKFNFYPNKEITRAEFIKLAVAAMRLNPDNYKDLELPFTDTGDIPLWAVNYIKAGYSNGWLRGKSSSKGLIVDASSKITREEVVTILYRIKAIVSSEETMAFTDNENISKYAREAITNFAISKIVNGYEDGSFKPANNIKRGEAAKIIAEWIIKALR